MRKVTKEYIKKVFDECNEKYFNNELKNCKFSLFYTKRTKGFCYFKKVNGNIHGRIGIAKNVIWNEDTFKEMVIHEMIHLYNKQIENISPSWFCHNWHFRRKLKELNKEYDLHMTICHPNIYCIKEKVPSTFLGKLMRRIRFELCI